MIKELYIYTVSGPKILIDIDDTFSVVRNYVTPYFSDAERLFQNASYSNKLPLTEITAAAFGYADREDMDADIPYDYLYADYYIDGLPIFEKAEVKVLSYENDYIEVQFVWGIIRENYINLTENYLNEIAYSGSIPESDWSVNWNRVDMLASGKKYNYYDYTSLLRNTVVETISGVRQPDPQPESPIKENMKEMTMHPFIPLNNILDTINTNEGLSIDFSGIKTRLSNKGIILTGLKDGGLHPGSVSASGTTPDFNPSSYVGGLMDFSSVGFSSAYQYFSLLSTDNYKIIVDSDKVYDKKCIINTSLTYASNSGAYQIKLRVFKGENYTDISMDNWVNPTPPPSYSYAGTFSLTDYELDLTDVTHIGIYAKYINVVSFLSYFTIDYDYKTPIFGYYPNNGYYDCIANLPNITELRFIQQCMILSGAFATNDTDGNIRFIFLEEFKNNLASGNYVDWTGRISKANKAFFQFNSNAKNNYLKFKNDEDVLGRSSVLSVSDNTIETEKDLYVIDFDSAENGEGNKSEVILYEQSVKTGDNGAVSFENSYKENYKFPLIYNSSGTLINQSIIGTNYDIYQNLIYRPVVKEVEINLGLFESSNIDFTKPVYIGEWGRYCMILEVNAPDAELSTVKVLIINRAL